MAATESYAASEDIIGRFVSENCHVGEDFRVKSKALVARFRQWCEEVGEPQLSTKRLGKWLTERGHERFRSDGYWWRGIGLQADESASVEIWSKMKNSAVHFWRKLTFKRAVKIFVFKRVLIVSKNEKVLNRVPKWNHGTIGTEFRYKRLRSSL